MLFKSCPIGCDSTFKETRIVLAEGPLMRCTHCGQLLSQCDEAVYNEMMARFEDSRQIDRNPRAHKRRLKRIEKYWRIPPEDTRFLDVGCSFGTFLNVLRDRGYMYEGVEPSRNAAKVCAQAGHKVFNGLLEEARFMDGQFDVLSMFEVIEHLVDPRPLLEECHRVLIKGGMLFLSTGNAESWTARAMKGKWDYFDTQGGGAGHISFFNPNSLGTLAEGAGFTVEGIETRRVMLVDKKLQTGAKYTLGKLTQELLGLPAKAFLKGHDMLIALRK